MYDILIKYFNSYVSTPLTVDEIDMIQSFFVPKRFRKRQFFLQEGELCKSTSFILQGAMCQYSVNEKGEEHVLNLFVEKWWACDRESLMNQTPSLYFIDTWEDTEALLITKTNISNLVDQIPALSEWARKLDADSAIASQRRIRAAISLSAQERYYDLEKAHPEFLHRFPQHIIASYLGITRETLSRIRSRGRKKVIAFASAMPIQVVTFITLFICYLSPF
jgi:CRP-like cAMP-binding protein